MIQPLCYMVVEYDVGGVMVAIAGTSVFGNRDESCMTSIPPEEKEFDEDVAEDPDLWASTKTIIWTQVFW